MARGDRSLVPSSRELTELSDEKVQTLVGLAENQSRRSHVYALCGLVRGTLSFLACLACFVYLVMHSHDEAASVVLGASVLAIITGMVRGRERDAGSGA
jgi:hypothetical protein